MKTKKEKKQGGKIKTFLKGIGGVVFVFILMFIGIAVIFGINVFMDKYKVEKSLMPIILLLLFYITAFCDFCIIWSLIRDLSNCIFKRKKEKNYEDKNVKSTFIKILVEIYGICYMYAMLLIFSDYSIACKFLKKEIWQVKYVVLINAILVLIAIIYYCFDNYFTYSKIEKCNFSKEVCEYLNTRDYNNVKTVALMMFLTLFCYFLCEGINYNKDFFIMCGLFTVVITVFQLIVMKHINVDKSDFKKKKKKISYFFSIFSIIAMNVIFIVPNVLYINSHFGVKEIGYLNTATCYKEYSVHHLRRGGNSYSLTITNPENGKKYEFSITEESYYNQNYLNNTKIKIYKGILQLEWAGM